MAKYAQGYERKNSDTKNLIILFSSIVGVVLLAIVGVIIYNVVKKEDRTYSYSDVSAYIIDDTITEYESGSYFKGDGEQGDSKLLYNDDFGKSYYLFFYTKSETNQDTIKAVVDYIEKEKTPKLYIFELPSSTEKLQAALDTTTSLQAGMLVLIKDQGSLVGEAPIRIYSDGVSQLKELVK